MTTADLGMSKIPQAGIYAIENTQNGRVYVGSSINLDCRLATHAHDLSRASHYSQRIAADVREFGLDAFRFTILQRVTDLTELEYLEHVWMRRLNALGANGYNTNPARRVPDMQPSEEALEQFDAQFETLTAGLTNAEAARVLTQMQIVTPHGGFIWTGTSVKQFRMFVRHRQNRRQAETKFNTGGERERLLARIEEMRSSALPWKKVLEMLTTEGFRVPGTGKAWTQHLLKPLLNPSPD